MRKKPLVGPLDIQQWMYRDSNGTSLLVNPLAHGDRLGEEPPGLFDTQEQAAIQSLGRLPVRITMLYGRHERAEDLNMPGDPHFYERVLLHSGLDGYFYEGIGNGKFSRQLDSIWGGILSVLPLGVKDFSDRRSFAMMHTKSFVRNYDIGRQQSGVNGLALAAESARRELFIQRYDSRKLLETLVVSQYLREWAIVPNLGQLCVELITERPGKEAYESLVTIGGGHTDISRKLMCFGAVVTDRYSESFDIAANMTTGVPWVLTHVPQIIRSGTISAELFEAFDRVWGVSSR